jgi:hypothetical protein
MSRFQHNGRVTSAERIGHALLGVAIAWLISGLLWRVVQHPSWVRSPLFLISYYVYACTPLSVPSIGIIGAIGGVAALNRCRYNRPLAVVGYVSFSIVTGCILIPYWREYWQFVGGW